MKRMSMIQRNVAAAPVHTRIMTSTFGFPSPPGKKRTVVNLRTTLVKKHCVLFVISEVVILYAGDLWRIVIKRKRLQSVTNLQMPGLRLKMRGPFFTSFFGLFVSNQIFLWDCTQKRSGNTLWCLLLVCLGRAYHSFSKRGFFQTLFF